MVSTNFDQRYTLEEKLGEGAFGCVMRCKNRDTGISFAAKIMKATCPDFSEVSNLKEISILRKIPKHLNVLRLEEVFVNRCSRQVTLIFPLMHKNLEEYIRTAEYIGEKRSKEIFYQMMTGINHLHSYKVFHRDIKPENILLRGSLVVIGDMGSLQYIKTKGHHTEYIATRWYRSPECLLTAGYYSWEMDIWAAACVFYETLTGNPLFPGDSEIDQLDRIHRVLGTPKPETLEKFEKYKSSNFTYHFKQHSSSFNNLIPNVQDKGRKLLLEMIRYDPKHRPTAGMILSDSYFTDLTQLKQNMQQEHLMQKIAKRNASVKISHPTHILAKPSYRPEISKLVQSNVDTHRIEKTKSDYLHQVRVSKYKFDQSSSGFLRSKNFQSKRKLFIKEKKSDLESRQQVQHELQERKSKIKQKLIKISLETNKNL